MEAKPTAGPTGLGHAEDVMAGKSRHIVMVRGCSQTRNRAT